MITAPASGHRPLIEMFPPARSALGQLALITAGTLPLAASAKVAVPFWPVPATLQSLVVLLIGMAYGSRLGAATVAAYLGEGVAGLPVFAGAAAGPAVLAGATGGYLLGFVAAAALVGWLAERGWDRTLGRSAAAMALGHVVLFVPGVLWLASLVGWHAAIAYGLTPFIAGTVVKTALGAALVATARRRLRTSPAAR